MLKKLTSLITVIAMLSVCIVPGAFAQAPEGYDYVIYSNDFQNATVGENPDSAEINYRPENCNYAVVQEGDNRYYTFSPNSSSKRANSGNLEEDYFLPATVVEKPIRKVKVEMDIAVDLKSTNTTADLTTYFRGTDAGGHRNSPWSLVVFNSSQYYSFADQSTKITYTPGDWIHFTIYADYENNLCSIYSDDGFAVENVALADSKGVDKFTQYRVRFEKGESNDSAIMIDNLVYSTTRDVFEAIGGVVGGDEEGGNDDDGNDDGNDDDGNVDSIKDYNVIVYSNDFEESPAGAGLTEEEMNYRPENCDYAVVDEGNNKYYTFSPNNAGKRANSGNITNGYLSSASVAVNPIRQIKVDMKVALDLDGGKTAGIATYYSGKNLAGVNGVRRNIVTFTESEYYSETYTDIRADYTPGEWMHFTLYLDYLNNRATVYANEILFAEDVPIFADSKNDRFTQIRLIMDPGTSLDSSIRVDDIVYATTEDEYNSFRYSNLYPELTDPKPYDYNRVLFEEDFEGDTIYSRTDFEAKSNKNIEIESGDSNTDSAKDQGSYINVAAVDIENDNYFRVRYGVEDAPVQASGVTIDELGKMQISFDLCPVSDDDINVRFLDKWSNPDSTKGETLIVGKGGVLSFANCDTTLPYVLNEWMSFDVFFDFAAKIYTVYLNGNAVVKNVPLKVLTTCAENVGLTFAGSKTPQSYSIYMDNFRIAIPNKFEVVSTIPENGSTGANVLDDVIIELSNNLKSFNESLVSVMVSGDKADCKISAKDNVITISFPEGMDFDTEYTVTLSKNITDIYGNTLGEDIVGSYITMSEQIASSVPAMKDKITAKVINPGTTPIDAVLVVTVVSPDGSSELYTDEVQIPAGKTKDFAVDYDISSAAEDQVVTAFVADSLDSLKPLRDVYATLDDSTVSGIDTPANAVVESVQIVDSVVTVKGSLSVKGSVNVFLKVSDDSGNTVMVLPVVTDENSKFSYSYSASGRAAGTYTVEIAGYNVAESNAKEYVQLSDAKMLEIKNAINDASNETEVKKSLEKYKDDMRLEDDLYNQNTYNVLAEQAPYASYDEMLSIIYTAEELLEQLNIADWSEYTKLFEENEDILFAHSYRYEDYSDFSANKKNAINKILVDEAPFATFAQLRNALDSAVERYESSSSSASSGGGGGGGGGGSIGSSGLASSYNVGSVEYSQTPDSDVLFADMTLADWAKAHVNVLYSKGIVSGAASYRPLDNVTREEFVKMLVQLAGLYVSGTPDFTDVRGDEWFAPYLAAAQRAGIIKGSDNGSFGVGSNITRQDMVVMAQRTVSVMNKTVKQTKEPVQFADNASISDYAVSAVSEMQRAGVVSGMGNGLFEPLGLANRAQAAVVICNLMNAME